MWRDTDYWAASYGEAMRWVNARAADAPSRPHLVVAAGTTYVRDLCDYYAAENVEVVSTEDYPDLPPARRDVAFYLVTSRFGWHTRIPEPTRLVHAVQREGATLTEIRVPVRR